MRTPVYIIAALLTLAVTAPVAGQMVADTTFRTPRTTRVSMLHYEDYAVPR